MTKRHHRLVKRPGKYNGGFNSYEHYMRFREGDDWSFVDYIYAESMDAAQQLIRERTESEEREWTE
jgi:hypothetical protein